MMKMENQDSPKPKKKVSILQVADTAAKYRMNQNELFELRQWHQDRADYYKSQMEAEKGLVAFTAIHKAIVAESEFQIKMINNLISN
jgi:hypothetical protein